MSAPEPLTPRDITTLERAVKRYQSFGADASLGVVNPTHGLAEIWFSNLQLSGTFQLRISKFSGNYGTVAWVIQIARSDGLTMNLKDIGQVSSNILLFALTKAENLIATEVPERVHLRTAGGSARQSGPADLEKLATALGVTDSSPKAVMGYATAKRGTRQQSGRRPSLPETGMSTSDAAKLMAILGSVQPERPR